MKLIWPSVRVPVLSVNSTSMSPRSSMHTSRLTRTLRRASCREPAARLVETTAGSSCGEMPTAIAREKSSASITGRSSRRFTAKIPAVSTPATLTSSSENRRNPTWNSVSGCRSPSPNAIRPNSVNPPVATTTPRPAPERTTVPINPQLRSSARAVSGGTGSVDFSAGADSPVNTASTHCSAVADSSRTSAGTTSPSCSSTTSPGTRSTTSTACG